MQPIHNNHKRSITSILRTVDKQLIQIKRWANGEIAEGVLYREENNLSVSQRKALLDQIERLTMLMRQIKEKLDLPSQLVDINQIILGRSGVLWQNVMEMHSRYLKGYGEVSDEFSEDWDLGVDELIGCIDNIMTIISLPEESGPG